MQAQPHSADQFGPQRDFWWHRDFLDLMAARWRLREATSLADIGCGRCHWSRLLYPYLRPPARITGVDREPQWVAEAPQLFRRQFPEVLPEQLTFVVGDATNLPLPDDSFDVVTCQTVLMHLAQPREALREMRRVLRPGGLLLCAEPNNFWSYLAFTSLTAGESVEVLVRRFEFWLRYHRGRRAAGLGDQAIGDLVPGYFAELGLTEIEVFQSDRCAALFPPYATAEQRAVMEQDRAWQAAARVAPERDEMQRHVLAGGGTAEFFARVSGELNDKFAAEQRALAGGEFHAANGGLLYLVSGRKP